MKLFSSRAMIRPRAEIARATIFKYIGIVST